MATPSPAGDDARGGADATIQRLAFLAAAGELLASSLDYAHTLQEVARLAVPTLGDMCIVDVVEGGVLSRVAATHVDPAKATLVEQLRERYSPHPDPRHPSVRVLQTGQFELLADVTPDVVTTRTRDADHADLVRAIGVRSHLAVPLTARGVTIGVISLAISESARRYGPRDVAFAQDLARQAALAIDNA